MWKAMDLRLLSDLTSLTSFPLQHQNFEESQEAMKQQLLQLSILLKALDPELCDFLGSSANTHQFKYTKSRGKTGHTSY